MSRPAVVDTRQLKQAVQRLGTAAERGASDAVKVAIKQASAFYMSFDETDAVPYTSDAAGRIVLSSSSIENAESMEEVLAIQTQIAADTLNSVLQRRLKEALE